MLTLKDLNNDKIKSGWDNVKLQNTAADVFYQHQFMQLLRDASNNERLPFFNAEKAAPSNILNRNTMKDVNKTLAELHSSLLGAKTNEYIFGADLIALDLSLDKNKNLTPLLVAARNQYNNVDRPLKGEMDVSKEGLASRLQTEDKFFKREHGKERVDYQFMYNVDQLDERSRKKLMQITKPEQKKHKEKLEHKQQESQKNWKQNYTQYTKLVKENLSNDMQRFEVAELKPIYNVMTQHEMAQRQGTGMNIYNKTYDSPAAIKKAHEVFRQALDKIDLAQRENPKIKRDVLLDVSLRANKMGEKLTSKEISFEDKHRRAEHAKQMENVYGR